MKCPVKDCTAQLSVRDGKELLGSAKQATLKSNSSSKIATDRLTTELRHIAKAELDKNGISVELIDDDIYHWKVKFFDFDKSEPIAKDLNKHAKVFNSVVYFVRTAALI